MSRRLPESTLRLTLASVLALSGLKLVNVPKVYLAVGLGLVVAFVLAMLVRAQRQWHAQRLSAEALTSPD